MKKLMLPVALIGLLALTGCVGYGGGYYDSSYYGGSPYYGTPYGSGYYGSPYYSGGVVIEQRPTYIYGGTRYHRGARDRDRDGIANRYDRDRDGDGVPNRRDSSPNNPRRY